MRRYLLLLSLTLPPPTTTHQYMLASQNLFAFPSPPALHIAAPSRIQSHPPLVLPQPKLTQPDPRHNTNQHQDTGHNDCPVLNVRYIQRIRCPRGCANGRESQRRNHVPRHPVVLVDALSLVHSAVQTGCVVLRESDNRLDVDKHVEGEAQNGVRRRKVLVSGPRFVHLDDDEPRSEGARAQRVEESVGEGARALLRGSVCGLQDQGCLDGEQEAGGVEEGMRGEEDELLGEDGAPYDGSELSGLAHSQEVDGWMDGWMDGGVL